MCVPQIVTYVAVVKGWSTKKKKGELSRTMVLALKLLWLAKGTSQHEATSNSAKIKPIALVVIKLSQ